MATALATLRALASESLAPHSTQVDRLDRLRQRLGPGAPALFMKRDDLLSFGMGGNKVRKLQTVLAAARAAGADTLITCGGLQSNHCRATAAAGAALGMRVVLVVNGQPQATPTGNALLDRLFGADVRHVATRADRTTMMAAVAEELTELGRKPFVIPLGASTPLGAAGFARGVEELLTSSVSPTVIVHSSSSGGTQAGLIAGCALFGIKARIIGISADESSATLSSIVRGLLEQMSPMLGASASAIGLDRPIEVVDSFVGGGYGIATTQSQEALELTARAEGIVLDPVYTAKAMAGLLHLVRSQQVSEADRVLFWHTGGQAGLFA
ncbi:MAG: pyridoxal-phosphate dependent enzyme [Acidobacteria bacterium]|jgi:L-cysteate sulfo-lyase|nr:pyridoxal-phosphate dependent enzyme [Acidobacteriota bacterium]